MNSWKYAEMMKQLNPIDDEFFKKMAEDVGFCEEVLQVVLEDPELRVEQVITQDYVKNLQGRSVILDALCRLENGECVDIEVQKADDDDHVRRVRYNGACVTANVTDPGKKFEQVPDVCVVFITKKDIFKGNHVVYHVDSMIREVGEPVNDGWKRVFVNAEVKDDSPASRLMTIFTENDAYDDERFPRISARKRWFKENPKGEEEMCDIVRKIAEQERAEGRQEGLRKGFVSALQELGVGYPDAMHTLKEKFRLDDQAAEESMKLYWK